MSIRRRLDAELVRRKLARSRELARELIHSRKVCVNGIIADKPARQVLETDSITVGEALENTWVSRGSGKLLGALAAFTAIDVVGKVCLDAGASTGGFTDVLLDRGAWKVYAVDVGYGQLAWRLSQDERVVVMDRTNVRFLDPDHFYPVPSLITADLSFISLRTVLPALVNVASESADFVLMVKPQFEVGKHRLGKGGVVSDPGARAQSIRDVAGAGAALGLGCQGVAASPLPGPSGNVEYFLWLRHDCQPIGEDDIQRAIDSGPR